MISDKWMNLTILFIAKGKYLSKFIENFSTF